MGAPETSLPPAIREGVAVSADGICTWDLAEVRDVLDTARALGLASLCGEPYLDMPSGRCGISALRWTAGKRSQGESWDDYVARSARESAEQFEMRCTDAALRESAAGIRFVRESGLDPLDHVRAALRFRRPDGVVVPAPSRAKRRGVRPSPSRWTWYLVPPLSFALTIVLGAMHPILGGAIFFASFLACVAASVHLLFGQPDFGWPGRILLFLWNAWPPAGIVAVFISLAKSYP